MDIVLSSEDEVKIPHTENFSLSELSFAHKANVYIRYRG